jgi:Flp pilus assembly protein TadG
MRLPTGRKGRRGQAMVEFALILPILLLLVIGIVEFGRAWNISQTLTDAAREGARRSVLFDPSITEQTVRNTISNALTAGGVDPTKAQVDIVDQGSGLDSKVTITYPYRFVFFGPLMDWTVGQSTINLTTSFTMRNE